MREREYLVLPFPGRWSLKFIYCTSFYVTDFKSGVLVKMALNGSNFFDISPVQKILREIERNRAGLDSPNGNGLNLLC